MNNINNILANLSLEFIQNIYLIELTDIQHRIFLRFHYITRKRKASIQIESELYNFIT